MILLGIAGEKSSGKDTLSNIIVDKFGWISLKFADPLKNMLRTLFRTAGIPEDIIERMIEGDLKEVPHDVLCGKTPRYAMQILGTEFRDHLSPVLWTNIIENKIKQLDIEGEIGVVISDVRFPHEVDFIHKNNGYVVRVKRPSRNNNEFSNHISEQLINTLDVDETILNDTTIDELTLKAIKLL